MRLREDSDLTEVAEALNVLDELAQLNVVWDTLREAGRVGI